MNTQRLATGRLESWKTPTTVLLGSETAGMLRDAALYVCDAIPGCRMVILEGQGHGAMLDAPDFFASKVIELIATPKGFSSHTAG